MSTPKTIQISDILDEIARGASLDQSLNLIAQKARQNLRSPSCKIWVVKQGDICEQCPLAGICTNRQMCLHLATVSGLAAEKEYPRIPISILNTSLIVRGGVADFAGERDVGEKLFGAQQQAYPDSNNSYALFPLRGISGTVGLLGVFSNRPIAQEELQTLAHLAPAAVAAIRVAELQARCDALRERLEKGAKASVPEPAWAPRPGEESLQAADPLNADLLLLKAELEARQNELAGMRETVKQFHKKTSLLEETNEELRQYNTFLVEKVENLEDALRLDAETQQQAARAPETGQPAKEPGELLKINQELNERQQNLTARLTAVEQENADLQAEKSQLEDALKQLEALVPKLEESVDKLSSRIELSERLCAEMDERNRALADDNRELATRVQVNAKLIANLSHELRHPISSILGFASLMLDDPSFPLPEKQRHNLERIAGNARDLSEFINQILDYSKIEAGRMEVYAEPVAVEAIVEKVAGVAEGLKGKRPINLQIELEENLPTLHTDRTKLQQILVNLLSNAVKFTDAGEVKVVASMADETHLRLAVTDTGIGIAESDIGNIFAEFYQANTPLRFEKTGSGLGLAITHRLIHLLKGEIEVFSKPGEGSIFAVILPIKIDSSEAPWNEAETQLLDPQRTALLISRDAATIYLVKKYLTEASYSVATSDDLARGLDIVAMAKPGFILVDLDGMENSAQAINQIRSRNEGGKLIAFSLERDAEAKAVRSGAEIFLTKPVEREELLGALDKPETSIPDYVLVVDDDADTVEIVKAMLESQGRQVQTAANGRQALHLVTQQKPQAIILDLTLPEMDGFEVAHRLHLNPLWSEIPIVLLTARDLTNEERAVLQTPSTRLLQKGSFDREQLLEELDNLTGDNQNINDQSSEEKE